MDRFQQGSPIPITFPLQDDCAMPTALRWRVLDEAEDTLLEWAAAPIETEDAVTVTIPGGVTLLTAPAVRGIRVVELEVITASGAVRLLSQSVMVQGTTALAFGINSFQTYGQASLVAAGYATLEGWGAVEGRDQREGALSEAYDRILRLPIGIHFDDEQSRLIVDTTFVNVTGPHMLRDLNPEQMAALHPKMLKALRLGQVLEADAILSPDPTQRLREQGIISQTVGESSTFFNAATPMATVLGVSRQTMIVLGPWVRFGARIGRA
jgi:hypothetical protein